MSQESRGRLRNQEGAGSPGRAGLRAPFYPRGNDSASLQLCLLRGWSPPG